METESAGHPGGVRCPGVAFAHPADDGQWLYYSGSAPLTLHQESSKLDSVSRKFHD